MLAASRPAGGRWRRLAPSSLRRAGVPRPVAPRSGGPRPSSRSPLPTVAPLRGRRGYGRAVSGYALIIFFRLAPCPSRFCSWFLSARPLNKRLGDGKKKACGRYALFSPIAETFALIALEAMSRPTDTPPRKKRRGKRSLRSHLSPRVARGL